MIPREILKKIRQIELRTNRIVTGTLAAFHFNRRRNSAGFRAPSKTDTIHDVVRLNVKVDAEAVRRTRK